MKVERSYRKNVGSVTTRLGLAKQNSHYATTDVLSNQSVRQLLQGVQLPAHLNRSYVWAYFFPERDTCTSILSSIASSIPEIFSKFSGREPLYLASIERNFKSEQN